MNKEEKYSPIDYKVERDLSSINHKSKLPKRNFPRLLVWVLFILCLISFSMNIYYQNKLAQTNARLDSIVDRVDKLEWKFEIESKEEEGN